jgi:hypothetical protein
MPSSQADEPWWADQGGLRQRPAFLYNIKDTCCAIQARGRVSLTFAFAARIGIFT